MADPSNVRGVQTEFVVLLDTQFSYLHILVDIETGVFQCFPGTGHGAAIDGNQHLPSLGGLDHAAYMPADAGQTEIPANATLREFDGRLVRGLPNVRATGTGKNEDLIRFA
jgi:hypothetical protein